MNPSFEPINDAMLDRLVDGELDASERRGVLAALDAQRDGWRRCALAFIEAQTWRRELREVVAEPVAVAAPSAADAGERVVEKQTSPATTVTGRSWRQGAGWLGLAASVLVAFGLGRQMGEQSVPVELAVDNQPPSPAAVHGGPAVADPDAVTLVVSDRQGAPHRVSVPLVNARDLGAAFSDTPNWSSPELDRRLDEQGLDLAARRRYVPLYFEQQHRRIPLVVPVDDAFVTPVSRPVY